MKRQKGVYLQRPRLCGNRAACTSDLRGFEEAHVCGVGFYPMRAEFEFMGGARAHVKVSISVGYQSR